MDYKLFIDSDILLDILLIKEPHFDSSLSILLLRKQQQVELFTSPSIILSVNYIAQKQNNKVKAAKGVTELLKFLEIIESTKKIFVDCFTHNYTDIEDAVQYSTALQNTSLNYYITRNTRHFNFKNINLPVLNAYQFLKLIK